nr:hypothetical protein [Pseudonocardia sp. ICBG601]
MLFALMSGDILPPTVFNLGGSRGWAPTVQLTALLRARPAPGWLRSSPAPAPWRARPPVVGCRARSSTRTSPSSTRTAVPFCQARQLALAPQAAEGFLRSSHDEDRGTGWGTDRRGAARRAAGGRADAGDLVVAERFRPGRRS